MFKYLVYAHYVFPCYDLDLDLVSFLSPRDREQIAADWLEEYKKNNGSDDWFLDDIADFKAFVFVKAVD